MELRRESLFTSNARVMVFFAKDIHSYFTSSQLYHLRTERSEKKEKRRKKKVE
jgi:hypothetical protein